MRNNPEKYKWSLFYFDQEDTGVIVPKNLQGMGWTLNFAQPDAFLVVVGLVLLILITSIL